MVDRELLALELDALARLAPELYGLAAKVNKPSSLPETTTDTPTVITATAVSAEKLFVFRSKVAQRFTSMADRVDRARTEFANADADRAAVITGLNSQEPPSSAPIQV